MKCLYIVILTISACGGGGTVSKTDTPTVRTSSRIGEDLEDTYFDGRMKLTEDGSKAVYISGATEAFRAYWIDLSSEGAIHRFSTDDGATTSESEVAISEDGTRAALIGSAAGQQDVFVVAVAEDAELIRVTDSSELKRDVSISHDGDLVSYIQEASGTSGYEYKLYVQSVADDNAVSDAVEVFTTTYRLDDPQFVEDSSGLYRLVWLEASTDGTGSYVKSKRFSSLADAATAEAEEDLSATFVFTDLGLRAGEANFSVVSPLNPNTATKANYLRDVVEESEETPSAEEEEPTILRRSALFHATYDAAEASEWIMDAVQIQDHDLSNDQTSVAVASGVLNCTVAGSAVTHFGRLLYVANLAASEPEVVTIVPYLLDGEWTAAISDPCSAYAEDQAVADSDQADFTITAVSMSSGSTMSNLKLIYQTSFDEEVGKLGDPELYELTYTVSESSADVSIRKLTDNSL